MNKRSPDKVQKELSRRILRNWLVSLLVFVILGGALGYFFRGQVEAWLAISIGAFIGAMIIGLVFTFTYLFREGIV